MEWLQSLNPSTKILMCTGLGLGVTYVGFSYYRYRYGWSSIEDYNAVHSPIPQKNPGGKRLIWTGNEDFDTAREQHMNNIDFEIDFENIPKDEEIGEDWVTPTASNDNLVCRFVHSEEETTESNSPRERGPVESESVMDDDFEVDRKPSRKILILGLEESGKSALLSQLSKEDNECSSYLPTKGFNVVCISFEKLDLNIWEIGGALEYRSYWKNFSQSTDLILFAIDSSDRAKFPLAKVYFHEVIGQANGDSDFSIIATKCDIEGSATCEEIQTALGLDGMEVTIVRVAVKNGGAERNIGLEEVQQCCLMESKD